MSKVRLLGKWLLVCTFSQTFELPKRGQFLSLGRDGDGDPAMWILFDPDDEVEDVTILGLQTGREYPQEVTENSHYLGTLSTSAGLVWHFFEKMPDLEAWRARTGMADK